MTRAKGPKHTVYYRRRREGRTNYAKRLALVKSGKTRMTVRRSNKGVVIQFINFEHEGDRTLLTVTGTTWRNSTNGHPRGTNGRHISPG